MRRWILLEAKTKECGLINEEVEEAIGIEPVAYYMKKEGKLIFIAKR